MNINIQKALKFHKDGNLKDAEILYRKILKADPKLSFVHLNLGVLLFVLSRFNDAELSIRKAIELKPDYPEAYNTLSTVLHKIKKTKEAEACVKKALTLKKDFSEAYINLSYILRESGRLEEAEEIYKKAIKQSSNLSIFLKGYSRNISYMETTKYAVKKLEKLWLEHDDKNNSAIKLPLAIHYFLNGDLNSSRKLVNSYFANISNIKKINNKDGDNYWIWLNYLLDYHEKIEQHDETKFQSNTLYVIGDSHALSSHGIKIKKLKYDFISKCEWIWGCKQWHLQKGHNNKFKYKFEKIISSIPLKSEMLMSVGEIDCRIDEGILVYNKKNPKENINLLIDKTINGYLSYILGAVLPYDHKITIQGIPCPNLDISKINESDLRNLAKLIKKFNNVLKTKSLSFGFDFLDLGVITDNGEGISNKIWHIDQYHISPSGIKEAWQKQF